MHGELCPALLGTAMEVVPKMEEIYYSLWSIKLATLFSATGGFGSAIPVEYMDFVPELGW